MGEGGVEDLPFSSQVSVLRGCYLRYANFMSLNDNESVIVSVVSFSMLRGSREKSKQCQSSQDFFTHWALDAVLIG